MKPVTSTRTALPFASLPKIWISGPPGALLYSTWLMARTSPSETSGGQGALVHASGDCACEAISGDHLSTEIPCKRSSLVHPPRFPCIQLPFLDRQDTVAADPDRDSERTAAHAIFAFQHR